MKKLFSVTFWVAAIFTLILLLVFGSACYLAYLTLDEKPADIPVRVPDMEATASVYKKLDLAGAMMAAFKKQKDGGAADKSKRVELNEKEVNAIIYSSIIFARQAMSGKKEAEELRDVYFADGAFTVVISKKMDFKTPFGSYVNIKLTFVPGIRNRHITAETRAVKVGSLEIPASSIEDKISAAVRDAEKNPDAQPLLDIVSEFGVEKGRAVIVYSPEKLLKFAMQKGVFSGGGITPSEGLPALRK